MEFSIRCEKLHAIISENGAELQSLKLDGREYLWQGDAAYWTGRSPILFPFVGALDKKGVLLRDKYYYMPQHGFARRSKFLPLSHSDTSITLELTDSDISRETYPFRFSLQAEYTLTGSALRIAFYVTNRDDAPMPFCIGAHPAFLCPTNGNRFEDYELVFDRKEQVDSWTINAELGMIDPLALRPMLKNSSRIPLDYSLFDNGALIFNDLCSRTVTLKNRNDAHSATVDFSEFPMLGFWTPPKKRAPFLCIEPWVGVNAMIGESGRFEDKPYAVILQPGEKRSFSYTISLQ